MSHSKKIVFAVAVSWLSRASAIIAKLFLIPILFRYMGKEELGIWFLLADSQGLMSLLGLGVIPTLTRHIAFAKGKSSTATTVELKEEMQQQVADLVVTGRTVCRWLAMAIFLISWIVGYKSIANMHFSDVSSQQVLWAWTVISVGYAIEVWVSYLECWLTGMGYVGWDNLVATGVNLASILASILIVVNGGGLVALAIVFVAFSLLRRFLLIGIIRWKQSNSIQIQGRWNKNYFQAMVNPALLAWLTNLGAFLIMRTDTYFITAFKGVQDIPAYYATLQLVVNLFAIASSFALISPVFISQAWQAGDFKTIHKITLRNAKLGLTLMASGVAFLITSGKELISLWLGQENFLGYAILIVFCITYTLELQHVTLALSSRATEDEKYVPWALTAGLLNFIFSWALIGRFGLLGVAMGTMLAQLLTNNWYQVYRPIVRLRLNFFVYLREVIGLWATVSIACLGLSWLGKQILLSLGLNSEWYRLILTMVICGLVVFIAFWQAILEKWHRESLRNKAKQLFAIYS